MSNTKPTYEQLEERLATAEAIVEALKHHEVDAILGEGKITFLLLKKVEEALINSEAAFDALFDLCGIGVIQADTPSLRFTRVNRKFCALTGYSEEELHAKVYLELTHLPDRHHDMKALSRVLRGKTDSWSIEKHCVRKDGSIIRVGVYGVVLRDVAGHVIRILAMVAKLPTSQQTEQEHDDAEEEPNKRDQKLTAELAQKKDARRRRSKATVKKSRRAADTKASD